MRSDIFETRNLFFSAINAFKGFLKAFKSEKNLHTEVAIAIIFLILNIYFDIGLVGWAAYITATFGTLSAELLNTAIEYICNYIEPDYDEKIRNIKDIASAPVLMWGIVFFSSEAIFLGRRILTMLAAG